MCLCQRRIPFISGRFPLRPSGRIPGQSEQHERTPTLDRTEKSVSLPRFTAQSSRMEHTFNIFLIVMAVTALAVFVALHYFEAGYGYLFDRRYGPPMPNRIGWVVMESRSSSSCSSSGPLPGTHAAGRAAHALPALSRAHYFQRSFIFPAAHPRQLEDAARHCPHGHALQHAQRPDAGRLDLTSPPRTTTTAGLQSPISIWRRAVPCRHGHQPPLGLHHPPPPQARGHAPLHPPRRHVPLRLVGQLFRRAARMGRLRHRPRGRGPEWSSPGGPLPIWHPCAASLRRRYEREFGEEFTRLKRKRIIPFIY